MGDKRYTVHVVPETHWDREYYVPFQGYRRRLVSTVDKLLALLEGDPDFRCFVFDGQTIVLEDYLAIRPENRERLAAQVRAGRLQVGPSYMLPDEWLVSGEALVHNLLLGHLIGEDFGRVMKAGYYPDPFGHVSQMPQIMAGFGIGSFIFMRGVGDREWEQAREKTEFWWEASDGTRVLAVHMRNSYCNAMLLGWRGDRLSEDPVAEMGFAAEHSRGQVDSLGALATTRHLLFNNGCDMSVAQPDLTPVLAHLNATFEDAEFRHASYEEYVAAVLAEKPDLGVVRGELHGGKFWQMLTGIRSSRMYLKLRNETCQALLERYAEPLQALAWLEGADYEAALLWHAWRQLLACQPHDSIGGCSGDPVHFEMLSRFDQSEQVGEILAGEGAARVGRRLAVAVREVPAGAPYARKLVVFNPSARRRREVVTFPTSAALTPSTPAPSVVVRDAAGEAVPAQVSRSAVGEYRFGEPREMMHWSFDLSWVADVPALGFRAYSAVSAAPGAASEATATAVSAGTDWMDNGRLRVRVKPDGSVFAEDLATGLRVGPLNVFEDEEDAGDEYDWSYAPSGRTVSSEGQPATISLVDAGPVRATLRIDRRMVVPAELAPGRQSRSEETAELAITTLVSLAAESGRVDFETTVHNTAKDHRLRAVFCGGPEVDRCFAQGHFDVVERSLELPAAEGWSQAPQATHCTKGFVDISDGERGLGVVVFGLPEYEVKDCREGKAVAITLLRSCGWISRDDYQTRPYNVGPKFETPKAQCLGTYTFRYAVVPHAGLWQDADLWTEAEALRAPLRAWGAPLASGGEEGAEAGDEGGAGELSFVEIAPATMAVTAVKKAERSQDLVVRFVNIGDAEGEATIRCGMPVAAAWKANLNEEPGDELAVRGGEVRVTARAKEIVTVLLRPGRSTQSRATASTTAAG